MQRFCVGAGVRLVGLPVPDAFFQSPTDPLALPAFHAMLERFRMRPPE